MLSWELEIVEGPHMRASTGEDGHLRATLGPISWQWRVVRTDGNGQRTVLEEGTAETFDWAHRLVRIAMMQHTRASVPPNAAEGAMRSSEHGNA